MSELPHDRYVADVLAELERAGWEWVASWTGVDPARPLLLQAVVKFGPEVADLGVRWPNGLELRWCGPAPHGPAAWQWCHIPDVDDAEEWAALGVAGFAPPLDVVAQVECLIATGAPGPELTGQCAETERHVNAWLSRQAGGAR